MRDRIYFMLKPKYLLKLLVVLACLVTVFNLVRDNIKPHEITPMPHSEPPEIARGEYLSWEEVDKLFYRYSNALVIDVDTGLSFQVQRRGGTYHADVQPLTARDTAIMKMIYNGEWSWRRKAVVLEVGERRIAASMNGMPHGSGAIRGNNFKGHFCIHFRDSRVHQSGKENLAHQMMIWKSAGRYKQMLSTMSQEEIIEVFFTALDQQDVTLALKAMENPDQGLRALLESLDTEVDRVKVQRIRPDGESNNTFTVFLTLRYRGSERDAEKKITVKLADGGERGWLLTESGMDELLNRKASVEIILQGKFDDDDHCE